MHRKHRKRGARGAGRPARLLLGALLASLGASLAVGPVGAGGETDAGALFEATSRRSFDDVSHWVKVFDAPERDVWQKPARVVETLKVRAGQRVADLGAGTGYFSRYLSGAVGETGAVFAVEVEPALVVHLRQRAEQEGSDNLIPVLASLDNPRLPPQSLDLVLIVDTYHHIDDRLDYLRRLARTLATGGRIAIIDWRKQELPEGPPPPHKLARGQVVEELRRAGFRLAESHEFLPYQYFLVFERERS